jgi:hypothetical protein
MIRTGLTTYLSWKQPIKAKRAYDSLIHSRYRTGTGQGCATSINVHQLLCDRISSLRGLGSIIFVLPLMHKYEIQELAEKVDEIIRPLFPDILGGIDKCYVIF